MNTCDTCKHYTPSPYADHPPENVFFENRLQGECALMLYAGDSPTPVDGVRAWDTEGYWASCYVGPKFGCIHWATKS